MSDGTRLPSGIVHVAPCSLGRARRRGGETRGAETIYEATGFAPGAEEQGPTIASVLQEARERLGDDVFERERARGCDLTLPEAIALADDSLRRGLAS